MRRRDVVRLLSAVTVWPHIAVAQTARKIAKIGLLSAGAPISDSSPNGTALIRGFAQHGYELGKSLFCERRGAEGHIEQLPALAGDLVSAGVDVIVTTGYPAALAAKRAGKLPVVASNAGDPVGTGLVETLSRPGGNLTGISDVSAEVTPKRIALLKELNPHLRRVAMLWNANDLGMTLRFQASGSGAQALGITVQPLGVGEPNDFDQAFEAMTREMPDAILMVTDSLTVLNRKRVFEFAAAHRLPAIYEFAFLVRDGGLMSYGPDEDESLERVAALVDRILKGASPAELPFEQPTKFVFALNLKTAHSLDISVPASLLALADEVVE